MTLHDLECEYAKLFDKIESSLPDPEKWYGDHKRRRFRQTIPVPVVFHMVTEMDAFPVYAMQPIAEWEIVEFVEEEEAQRYNADRLVVDYIRRFYKSWENASDHPAFMVRIWEVLWKEVPPLLQNHVWANVWLWFTTQKKGSWKSLPVPPDVKPPVTKLKWKLVEDGKSEWMRQAKKEAGL